MTIYDKLATHRDEILRLAALRGAHNVRVLRDALALEDVA